MNPQRRRFLFSAASVAATAGLVRPVDAQWAPLTLPDETDTASTEKPAEPEPFKIRHDELSYARTAWSYFTANEDPDTGLVSAVNNFSSTTLWDEGGYLLAIVAAHA